MLSPTLAPPPPQSADGGSPLQSPTTRRRGLSYLRSLSSRDHNSSNTTTDAPRTSPRHFFTRSTSYQETKDSRNGEGRRRSQSHSRPNGPIATLASSTSLVRVASEQGTETRAETTDSNPAPSSANADDMTRNRASSRRQTTTEAAPSLDVGAPMSRSVSATTPGVAEGVVDPKTGLPTIRFLPHQEQSRLGRQSLNFSPISRTLPSDGSIIRVGRYSEREGPAAANPTGPSDAPVGFKSKVVSRKHCEFSFVDGQWQVRDVASSSGTFLNHIRLSQPNLESRLYPVKDGDIIQLGIDFRGGEEMIFRCVKIRIECNRSWQKKPNNFNKQRQAQLRGLVKDQPAASANSGECSICLGNVLPCQALFVAPCAHVWHYKCIRPMLEGRQSQYPQFQCPNCRAYTDLEADVDVDMEDWAEDDSADQDKDLHIDQTARPDSPAAGESTVDDQPEQERLATANTTNGVAEGSPPLETPTTANTTAPPVLSKGSLLARRQERGASPVSESLSPPMQTIPMPTRPSETEMQEHLAQQRTQTESPNSDQIIAGEGPLTPRNNAGPFVFDGSGSRTTSRRQIHIPEQSFGSLGDGIE